LIGLISVRTLKDERMMALAKKRVCCECHYRVLQRHLALHGTICKANWCQDQSINLKHYDLDWAERCTSFKPYDEEEHEKENLSGLHSS
jgi:hypothetical protein